MHAKLIKLATVTAVTVAVLGALGGRLDARPSLVEAEIPCA